MADFNSAYTGAQIDAAIAEAQTAVQPGDLGTAAAADTTDFATAAQGALADSAVQPGDDAANLGSGTATDGWVLTADGSGGAAWEAASGGGGTPGGSDTQVQFNDGGAFGGDSGFTFNKTAKTLTLGGATITTSSPVIAMAQTWNAGAVTFTGLRLNVTDTASAAGSLLMDLQVGGTSQFSVSKAGIAAVISGGGYAFSTDVFLRRDAANTLAQRNGVNAQAFNLYNTYTDASNYERGFMRWSSNVLQIGSDKLGTGTARDIDFLTNGLARARITSDGTFRSLTGYIYNITTVTGIWSSVSGNSYFGTESNHPISFRTNNVNRVTLDTVGSIQIVTALTVATLPSTPLTGMMARVTDATTPVVGSTVTGGGAAAALCWYNGINWTVIGV